MPASHAKIAMAVVAGTMLFLPLQTQSVRAQGQSRALADPASIVTATDVNLDGVADIVLTRTFTYQAGRAVGMILTVDGNPIIHADGVVDQVQTTTSSFGPHAEVLLDETQIDVNNDGTIDVRRVVTYTYDGRGSLTQRVTETFNAVTNVKTAEDVQTNTYDARGNLLTQHWAFDFGFNGTIDRVQDLTNTYDKRGDIIQNMSAIDENGDGTVDVRNTTTIQRDKNGKPNLQTTTIDDPAGGPIEEVRTVSGFDFHGNDILEVAMSRDVAPLGSPEWTSLSTYTYDQRGHLILRSQAIDLGNNGSVDNTLVNTNAWTQSGNIAQTYVEVDVNQDGFADQTVTTTYTY